jgi:geranylgeranyl pyrophosphate synthase
MANPLLTLPSTPRDLGRVEGALRDAVHTPDDLLNEMASHLVLAGGKRLRPLLATVAARAGGASVSDEVIRGGVAVELVHLGSLYHDDVLDEAETRRGVESVNAKWGNLKAILAGDFLLARASELAASLGAEVAGLLGHTIGRLCEGEVGRSTDRSSTRPSASSDRESASPGPSRRPGVSPTTRRRRPASAAPARSSTRWPPPATPWSTPLPAE